MPTAQRPEYCLNCGAKLTGNYCVECGQKGADFRLTFRELVADFIDGQFNLNSSLVRSVLTLMFRPGWMTREYNAGKRVRYVSPLRMYLVTSALFFLALAQVSLNTVVDLSLLENIETRELVPPPTNGETMLDEAGRPVEFPVNAAGQLRGITLTDMGQRDPTLRWLLERWQTATRGGLDVFRERFVATLLDNASRMMVFLLPVVALILKLLYVRRRWLYIEHVTFALHLHTFVFLVLMVLLLVGRRFSDWTFWSETAPNMALLVMTVYTFIALKVVYAQSYLKTALKMALLGVSYLVVVAIALTATTAISFLLL